MFKNFPVYFPFGPNHVGLNALAYFGAIIALGFAAGYLTA